MQILLTEEEYNKLKIGATINKKADYSEGWNNMGFYYTKKITEALEKEHFPKIKIDQILRNIGMSNYITYNKSNEKVEDNNDLKDTRDELYDILSM